MEALSPSSLPTTKSPAPFSRASRSRRLSVLAVGFTLLIVRFWKNGRIVSWQEIVSKLPRPLQVLLCSQQKLFRRLFQNVKLLVSNGNHNNENNNNFTNNSSKVSREDETSHQNQNIISQTALPEDRTEDEGLQVHIIRQNQSYIRQVLNYWFGQYEPDEAQKKLWMIASSSTVLKRRVDAEIAEQFTPLLCELAENANAESQGRWSQWCLPAAADQDIYGSAGKLAAIIVLDQFSRHIRRHYETNNQNDDESNNPLPPQHILDSLALKTARLLTEQHSQEIHCGMVPLPQYIFGLMPFRHAGTLETVQYVQNCVEEAARRNGQLEAMTSRFRKATNRRMAVLQDEARRKGEATVVVTTSNDNTNTVETGGGGEDTSVPLQVTEASAESANSNEITDEDILETFPFDADYTDAPNHPVVKTVQAFLVDRGIYPATSDTSALDAETKNNKQQKQKQKQNKNGKDNKKQKNKRKLQPSSSSHSNGNGSTSNGSSTQNADPCSIIISLSGGVDSMVIVSVLAYLKSTGGYTNLDLHAIHIDYANRPESKAESDYVQHYCQRLGVAFHVRRIDEVTRGVTARDEYEQMSRQVRYDMYRKVAQECGSRNQQQTVVGVMLGHHRGDLRENVLSNAHKGCGPLDLSGMTSVSQNDGVTIYRPLLPLEKIDVLDYAHHFGVPYFKDTTPHWSTRGKLRNKLLPLLEEIYGEGSMNNLSTLAVESDECRALLDDGLLKPFMDTVVRKPMGIIFETAPFVAQRRGLFFWKFVLREVLHSAGLGMFSDKSVASFLERICPEHTYKKSIRPGWLQCRRDYAVYLQKDGKVFVFYPDSFPWRKSDAYTCTGRIVEMDHENTIKVGPWTVNAGIWAVSGTEKEALTKKKAVASMDQFMEGFVEYFLAVPTRLTHDSGATTTAGDGGSEFSSMPLVFVDSFRKESRPPAWKNTDEKIQERLPLLGNTEESLVGLKDPLQSGFMHTSSVDGEEKVIANPVVLVRVTLDRRSA